MTPRRLLFALALLLAAWAMWWQLASPPPSPPVSNPATSEAATPPATAGAPALPDGATRIADAGDATNGDAATARVRIDVARPDGEPAVGALVRAGDRTAITDARGTATLTVPRGADVSATLGAFYGEGDWLEDWSGDVDRIQVGLAPDVPLVVEARDPAGVPQAGVFVHVEAAIATRRGGLYQQGWDLVTDARGRAELPHLQCRAGYVDGLAATVRITARVSDDDLAPLAAHACEWHELAAAPTVHLVVPSLGTVVVHIVGADGRPLHLDSELTSDGVRLAARTVDDTEVFAQVPLGRTWTLTIDRGTRSLAVRGPTRANEVVPVEVPWPTHAWCFRGRVVRADGLPWPDEPRAAITVRDPRLPETPLANLSLFLTHPLELHAQLEVAELPQLEVLVEPAPNTLAAARTFLVSRTLRAGDVELGDLALPAAPDLVELASFTAELDGRDVTDDANVRLLQDADGRQRPFPCLRRRRGDGAVLLGPGPAGGLQIDCWRFDCVSRDPIALRRGEHHHFELQRAASLRIDLVHDALPDEALVAELVPTHDADAEPSSGNVQAHCLSWSGLAPGSYTLCVRCGEQVLARASNVVLAAGPQRWPADGSPLDLRSARVLHVLARSGTATGPLLLVGVAATTADTTPDDELEWQDGWFVPQRTTTEVLVRASHHVPVRLVRPTADAVLTLQPMTTVQLRAASQVFVRIVTDGVADPLLRAADRDHEHRATFHCPSDAVLEFAPGTVLELTPVDAEPPARPRRVEVGRDSPLTIEWQ